VSQHAIDAPSELGADAAPEIIEQTHGQSHAVARQLAPDELDLGRGSRRKDCREIKARRLLGVDLQRIARQKLTQEVLPLELVAKLLDVIDLELPHHREHVEFAIRGSKKPPPVS
jgi:hypothetical protein